MKLKNYCIPVLAYIADIFNLNQLNASLQGKGSLSYVMKRKASKRIFVSERII